MKQKLNTLLTKLLYLTVGLLALYGLHTAHLEVACYSHADGIADLIEELD